MEMRQLLAGQTWLLRAGKDAFCMWKVLEGTVLVMVEVDSLL